MAMIDVDRVGLQNLLELVDEGRASSLNTKHIEDFSDVIGVGAIWVDLRVREDLAQVSSFGFEDNELKCPLLRLA